MQKADRLIRTKLRLPFTRPGLVLRARLHEQVVQGMRGPLTLITAPAGFGKTTLIASSIAACGVPAAWLSLDKDDNQAGRFLSYLAAALQEADPTVGSEAAELMAAAQEAPPETVLTSLINDLDAAGQDTLLVLDDYQFISSPAVHEAMAFLLEHCPCTFHLVIATRSDPPLPLARLRACGQMVELRAADLRFTEQEAAQFLNNVMGLRLDAGAVSVLEERTEGWIAGLQMAALSMRDRKDVSGFIEGFSGTNRYILDYLLEEVLDSQSPEIQRFLLHTSILERLTAPLCEAVLANDKELSPSQPASILEYLERANLFLVPLDDERQWYRYHHLFADLLRARLQKAVGDPGVIRLHLLASEWHEQNGATLEAIHHASLASDYEKIERLIEQNYIEMMNRGEMAWIRFWMGKLSQELVYRRPWLCLYEAFSRSWFGEPEEANALLNEAENRMRSESSAPDARSMRGYHDYVKSRVTAMQGDTQRAIAFCLAARENIPADNLGLQIEVSITLGFEYFLYGDFENATRTLYGTIRSGQIARAINNPVAAYAILARMQAYQGRLHEADALLQRADQLIQEAGGQYHGAAGLVEAEKASLACEWNDAEAALAHIKHSLEFLPSWGKCDDVCLAYTTLSRIQLALGNRTEAAEAIEKAARLIQNCGVFSEARSVVEASQVKIWLAQGDWSAADHWAAAYEQRFDSQATLRYEDELAHITRSRVSIAQNKPEEAIHLLARLEEFARSGGRQGRLIEILILKALAMQAPGDPQQTDCALTEGLALAEPEGYVRVFLDEGEPLHRLLAGRLARAGASPLRDYASRLLALFDLRAQGALAGPTTASPSRELVEPLSPREVEVLLLMAQGKTNSEIARQLFVSSGTVKAHTASIYRKLDVANRTEAAARARQLGILP